jgi:predicted membrane metal-binding protein
MKRLFASSAVFYCLGIVLVSLTRVNFWIILGLGIIILSAACLSFRNNHVFVVSVFFLVLILGALNLKNSYIQKKCHICNIVSYNDNTVYSLSGFVDSQPVTESERTTFIFRPQEIQLNNLKWLCCGKVLVRMDFPQDLNYAQRLTLTGVLSRPFRFSYGTRSYRDYLSGQGIYLLMRIRNRLQIIQQPGGGGNKLIIFSLWLRAKLEQIIRRYLPDLPAAILSAMVLGQRRSIPWLVNNQMIKSGTVHVLPAQ